MRTNTPTSNFSSQAKKLRKLIQQEHKKVKDNGQWLEISFLQCLFWYPSEHFISHSEIWESNKIVSIISELSFKGDIR